MYVEYKRLGNRFDCLFAVDIHDCIASVVSAEKFGCKIGRVTWQPPFQTGKKPQPRATIHSLLPSAYYQIFM
jgi:hypothetical protein